MKDALELLSKRRSVVANAMVPPGPDADQLSALLEIAARVPDHGKLAPWRFVLFQGEARVRFGQVLAERFAELTPDAEARLIEIEAARFLRAPVVICVVSRAAPHVKIPEWEQVLSAGAVCQNLLVAASAMGFASQWITEWYAFDEKTRAAIGLEPHEKIAGFVYVASAEEPPGERARPVLSDLISHWAG
jgi:nitroreductase